MNGDNEVRCATIPLNLSMKTFLHVSVGLVALGSLLFSCQEDSSLTSSSRKRWHPNPPVVIPPAGVPVPPPASPNPLESLPKDTGGIHKAVVLGSNASPYGYYLYTPSGYNTGAKFPLLIFLHGVGEIGNSSLDPKALDKILVHGPPKMIKDKTWAPEFPMVVASIQCHDSWYDWNKVKKVTEFLMANYQVDTSRIYMTGLSMGGFSVWDQITRFGKKSHLTAAVPISGAVSVYAEGTKNATLLPIWAFHGADDTTVIPAYDIAIQKAINLLKPAVPEKLTIYPATGHNAWTKTYNGTGMGTASPLYDPFNMDIYSWMFQYKK